MVDTASRALELWMVKVGKEVCRRLRPLPLFLFPIEEELEVEEGMM